MSEEQADYVAEAMEMIGIDLSEPKQIIQEVSGFTPIFDAVITQYKDETRAAVHGAMWRFCQMQDGVCKASLSTIGELIGVDVSTVSRHAEELVKDGYFVDLTPNLRNRPHVYVDTGKVVMKSKLTAGFAQSKATVAQSKATVAESRMSKDSKKDMNKDAANAAYLSVEEHEQVQKKFLAILEFERQAREKLNSGVWRGRELIPPHLLTYADWWHSVTNLDIKTKKPDSEWLKAFSKWYDNQVTLSTLDETYAAEVKWKEVIAKPSELTAKAIAIQALPKPDTTPTRPEHKPYIPEDDSQFVPRPT